MAAEDVDFALPVPTDGRSSRTKDIEHTIITVDPALAANPPDLSVIGIGFNTTYTPWEARNRLDVAVAKALIRRHAITEEHLDGTNIDALRLMWCGGDVPVEPNWGDYLARLSSDEELMMPIVALPADAPADAASVQRIPWVKCND